LSCNETRGRGNENKHGKELSMDKLKALAKKGAFGKTEACLHDSEKL
jgi:hypothetical protein